MTKISCKGSAPASTRAYIVREFGLPTWEKALAEVSPACREGMDKPLAFAWYPLQGFDELFVGLFRHCCHEDPLRADRFFREVGRYIAEDNLNTIYKVVLALAQADHIVTLLPRLWGNYFAGIDVKVERPDPAVRRGTCTVRHLPFHYVGPAASGWIEFAYEKVGCPNAKVTERNFVKGVVQADPYVFDLRWT
jgi:hypothetical protein